MKRIETVLLNEKQQIEKVVKDAKKRLNSAPKGRLRIAGKRNGVEYYYKSEAANSGLKWNNGKYMKKSEMKLVRALAQRDYDEQVVGMGEERIKAIEKFLIKYKQTCLKQLYQKTNKYRKELICADIISDDEYVRNWQNVKYTGKSFEDDLKVIVTERGERVRSKSEKIIADKLYSLGIPYRYEYPLMLDGNIRVYPDFIILRMPERKEVYLEHFGMMDDSGYVDNVIYKLNTYERNGIYLGVNLFITYETSKSTLNTRTLNALINNRFCSV